MLPYCLDTGVGVIPWSPLARGKLTRDWDEATDRSGTDEFGKTLFGQDGDRRIVEAVARIAADRGVSRAQVALAWVLAQEAVTAPIVGATKEHHLDDAIAATGLELSDDELDALEADYVPHRPTGF